MSAARGRKRTVIILLIAVLTAAALIAAAYFLGRIMDKRKYRLDYPDEIIAYADEYDLDRYLVAAVIHTESGGRADAVSPHGATGLMQLMPDTARWIAEKQGREDYADAELYTPEKNIGAGCWYLDYLMDKYGSERCALAAYNAGPGNVDKWLSDPKYGSDGALITIPFGETEEYLIRVDNAYEKYRELYAQILD